jgi:hypothetical protein
MRHDNVTGEELSRHVKLSELDICGHYGGGYHAQVKYNVGAGEYEVYDHRELLLRTPSAATAAAAYNLIRPRA